MKLTDKEWKEFKITDILSNSINSKAYHSSFLQEVLPGEKGVPYITRTNLNNGLFAVVKEKEFEINPKNTISFGAENATYFYQNFSYITGNKMYYYEKELSSYTMLFITSCLNKSISECGFGYGMGLTGSRSDSRKVMLPVNEQGQPDYQFMEDYIKQLMHQKRKEYIEYANKKIEEKKREEIEPLDSKQWREFFIVDIFHTIQRGKRLTRENQQDGNIPYVSSTAMNNGVDNFIQYNPSTMRKYNNCLSIANSGSVGSSFYEPFEYIASDHVTHLKNNSFSQNIYLS